MKKIISIVLLSLSLAFSTTSMKAQNKNYVSASVSVSNQNGLQLEEATYFSVEAGFLKENFSYGLAVGRGNFADFSNDEVENYWAELKCAPSFSLNKKVDLYLPLGIGSYFDSDSVFIEYGIGTSYAIKDNLSFFVQASNWSNDWYISPGFSYYF